MGIVAVIVEDVAWLFVQLHGYAVYVCQLEDSECRQKSVPFQMLEERILLQKQNQFPFLKLVIAVS